jgi:hypothetical protein
MFSSFISNPGVEVGIGDVDSQIDQDHGQGDEQNGHLHDGIIPR